MNVIVKLPLLILRIIFSRLFLITLLISSSLITSGYLLLNRTHSSIINNANELTNIKRLESIRFQLDKISQELNHLQNQDQLKINQSLQSDIKQIHINYSKAVKVYEDLHDLKATNIKTDKLDDQFSQILKYLSDKNYASASSKLADLGKLITQENQKRIDSFKIPDNLPQNNAPPGSGYRRQLVTALDSQYMVDIISADLNSTRVIIDTASENDCRDNCPVLPLADYVSRSGAFAGINGSYFCPSTYPSCVGKTNSFDTLLMNKNKKYFNSDNNVYSTVPAVIFSGNSARFVSQSLEWGRDTGVDAVIANHPLMVLNSQVTFGGNSDPKQGSKGPRSFIGASAKTAYIGIVHNSTVAEAAQVLKTMGVQNALNLDSGGSTALWSGGYKAGPGRNIPNAVLFIRR